MPVSLAPARRRSPGGPPGETAARSVSVLFPTVKRSLPGTFLSGTCRVCKGHMCRDVWLHCSRNGCLKVAKGTVAGARGHEGEAARCCAAGAVGELGRDGMGEG